MDGIKLLCGNSNRQLAEKIARELNVEITDATVKEFSDGETNITINESIRGYNTFVVQPTCTPTNKNLVELLLLIDAAKRCSAHHVSAVVPYYGYGRQERLTSRTAISAKAVASWIQVSGADHFLSIDLHSEAIAGFFEIPVDNMTAIPLMATHFRQKGFYENDNAVVVSPDTGGVKRARNFATRLNLPIAIVDKLRSRANESEVAHVVGNVEGKNCIIVDDIVDTGGSLSNAASILKDKGAKKVYAACTHPVLSGTGYERIADSELEELVTTDTIPLSESSRKKITQLSIAPILAECIKRTYSQQSITELFAK